MSQRIPVYIRGSGAYVPEKVLTNAFFQAYLDTSDEWIVPRTGIRERRQAAPTEATSNLAAQAGRLAIENAALKPEDIDLLILATSTPDTQIPAGACWVQPQLGLPAHVPAFDMNAACSGFVYGVAIGSQLVAAGGFRNVLVIGAETLTRFTDYEDRSTCILFGDGAGAVVLSRSDDPNRCILHFELGADGTRVNDIWSPAGGSRLPASANTVNERLHYMRMKGRELFRFAVVKMQDLIDRALEETGISAQDIKLVIPHQSNLRIIEAARQRLGLPPEKVAINIDRYGNTSAASVPLALDEARRCGRIVPGDNILLVAFGAGVTWGVVLLKL